MVEMREAERYIARFAGIEYEPVEHKTIEHVKVKATWYTYTSSTDPSNHYAKHR